MLKMKEIHLQEFSNVEINKLNLKLAAPQTIIFLISAR